MREIGHMSSSTNVRRVCMPTRHYGVVVPESQKVPCIISTYQRAYGSRTTDRPYVMETEDV